VMSQKTSAALEHSHDGCVRHATLDSLRLRLHSESGRWLPSPNSGFEIFVRGVRTGSQEPKSCFRSANLIAAPPFCCPSTWQPATPSVGHL